MRDRDTTLSCAGTELTRPDAPESGSIKSMLVRAGRAYKQLSSPISYLARSFIRRAAEEWPNGPGTGLCLDIGAGAAPYEMEIRRSFGVERYFAVDMAVSDRIKVVADACRLPFDSASVELVVSFDVIQHVADAERMLREMARVLKCEGYALMTFPFLYPECDVRDYRRWTIEGMERALTNAGLEPVLAKRRGGACFALACAFTWVLQHLVPGQRRSWRASRSSMGMARSALVAALTLPTQLVAWLALPLDGLLINRGIYMGGAILAKKTQRTIDCSGEKK